MGTVLLTTVSLSASLLRTTDLVFGCGGLCFRVTIALFVLQEPRALL